jgi:glutathione S-transferase
MYTLHTMPDTAGVAVHAVLQELGVSYRLNLFDRAAAFRDTPEYRALHPMGLVPALETPNGPMFETAAILLWLADRHGGLAPRVDEADRGTFLTWYFFTSSNLHATLMEIFYPERHTGTEEGNARFLQMQAARLGDQLRLLDGMATGTPRWCNGQVPSILGYYLAMLLRWVGQFAPGHPGRVDTAAFPALMALARALEDRPAARHVAMVEGLGPTIFSSPAL